MRKGCLFVCVVGWHLLRVRMGKSEEHERPDKREVVEIYISNLKSSSCVYTVP